MKFLTNIDLNKNQIINVAVHNNAGNPSSPVAGQIYFDTTTGVKTLYLYNGTAWVDILGGDISSVVAGAGLTGGGVTGPGVVPPVSPPLLQEKRTKGIATNANLNNFIIFNFILFIILSF